MQLQNMIIDALIQDGVSRKIESVNAFGDIIFSADNGYGETVHSICQIYLRGSAGFSDGVEKKVFFFDLRVLGVAKQKSKSLFFLKKTAIKISRDIQEEIMQRYGLLSVMKQRLGALNEHDVYGYCTQDDYNSDNPFAEKIQKDHYHQDVLQYIKNSPRREYSDIWPLDSPDSFSDKTQKLYYGYGFEVPKGIMSCANLRTLAIWGQVVNNDDIDFSKIKNVNELVLTDLHSTPNTLLSSLDQLPNLVSLVLSSRKEPYQKEPLHVPKALQSLNALRYFDFSGNPVDDWSPIVSSLSLKRLVLSNSDIRTVPENIANLTQLEELDLSDNNLSELPESLKLLTNLRVLNLSKNPLRVLPDWLTEMTGLNELNVSQTQLQSLPASIVNLHNLRSLVLKKNVFTSLPKQMLTIPKKTIELEERNKALYDDKVRTKMEKYPKGTSLFENDFNFKLLVIQKLMYEDEVLLPKFSVYRFADNHSARDINIEEEGYGVIPEVESYFKALPIPLELLIDIKELESDGGNDIYAQLIPFWDGEDESFTVESIADVDLLPNLKRVNSLFFSKPAIKQLRSRKIKVSHS